MAGHRGDVETVRDGLAHDAGRVRAVALGAAARAGMLDLAMVERFLTDDDPEVRRRAAELAARADFGPAAAPTILGLLDDPEVAEVAAFALGELPLDGPVAARAEAALGRQAIEHDDALCRESAVAALGALGRGLEFILAATGDVATVRRRAVLALAPFEGAEVDAALASALDDRDWQVRQAAEDLLGPPDPAPSDPAPSDSDPDPEDPQRNEPE